MATIVEHIESKKRYILLGGGLGVYQSAPNLAIKETGVEKYICVSNSIGGIQWLQSREVIVISIDGKSPDQHFHS